MTSSEGELDLNVLRDVCNQAAKLHDEGRQLIIVTSGAVASGKKSLGLAGTLSVSLQQASAAVGQSLLMERYNDFLGRHDKRAAQILLSRDDLANAARRESVAGTIEELFKLGAIPVVNENDAVAADELDHSADDGRFGDNDALAALLAETVQADALILLSNVDGLLDGNGKVITRAESGDPSLRALDNGTKNGRGGLASKLDAVENAATAGAACVIANGRTASVLCRLAAGENVGTFFASKRRARAIAEKAVAASRALCTAAQSVRDAALECMERAMRENVQEIISANEADVTASAGLNQALIERLKLDGVTGLAQTIRRVRGLDAGNEELSSRRLANGLILVKRRVPLGVLCVIFESRPDVVVECAALAVKSGNAVVLKGGKEAAGTNAAIAGAIRRAISEAGLPEDSVQLFPGSREELAELLSFDDCIDLVVPRGGQSLIDFVRKNSAAPVLYGGGGNCHVFVDKDADLAMAERIVLDAKLGKPSACNAAETLLVHSAIAREFLAGAGKKLVDAGVELRACNRGLALIKGAAAATEDDWRTEYSAPVLAVKIVDSLDEAIAHVNRYGTRHSEAIVTRDRGAAKRFQREVDAAAVYWNASTRFTDGGEYGFGAEVCISTQKLHARGPVGLEALYTYKYVVTGDGQTREQGPDSNTCPTEHINSFPA